MIKFKRTKRLKSKQEEYLRSLSTFVFDKFFDKYEGYISTHDYKRADNDQLADIAKKIIQ